MCMINTRGTVSPSALSTFIFSIIILIINLIRIFRIPELQLIIRNNSNISKFHMDEGPHQLLKLPFEGSTFRICSHQSLPYLLRISKYAFENYNITHSKTAKAFSISDEPHEIQNIKYANKKLIYSTKNHIRVNDHKLHVHSQDIKHLISDNSGLILTAAQHVNDRCIKIISTFEEKEPKIQQQFNFHYNPITSIYWRNSLVISGDSGGQICLWDINKCRPIFHRKAHYDPIQYIGVYVDYTLNNTFYTVSPEEKRLIISDLRTNKPIKILANLHSEEIISVGNTSSGKIYVAYSDIVDIIDIHHEYQMIGNYSPIVLDKATQMKWTAKSFSFKNIRKICNTTLMGKYLIVGCDNGCIEVYDTDTLECLYGFGLVKFGPIKDLECNSTYQYIYGLDAEGDVYMAHFGNKNDY